MMYIKTWQYTHDSTYAYVVLLMAIKQLNKLVFHPFYWVITFLIEDNFTYAVLWL